MAGMNGWDVGLMVLAAFVAVTVLVRLMLNRRDELLDDLSQASKRPKKKSTVKTTTTADRK